ncbi:hypothetical protein TKK_0003175 [Trichogramma kaykai]
MYKYFKYWFVFENEHDCLSPTLLELDRSLQEYPPLKSFYKGKVIAKDDSVSLIFINDKMLQPLNTCRQLFCDGTFKIRCRPSTCAQIFTIHFRKVHMSFPSIICFTSSMTFDLYDSI